MSFLLFVQEVLPLTFILFIPGYILASHFTIDPRKFLESHSETWFDILFPIIVAHSVLIIGHFLGVMLPLPHFIKFLISLCLPIEALIAIPISISRSATSSDQDHLFQGELAAITETSRAILGTILIGFGLYGFISTNYLFYSRGKGTLSPIMPPSVFVAEGLFRYVRNPMILSVLTISFAEGLLFNLKYIFYFTIFFFITHTFYLIFDEEPKLLQRFGKSYEVYFGKVSRWIPSITAYHANKSS